MRNFTFILLYFYCISNTIGQQNPWLLELYNEQTLSEYNKVIQFKNNSLLAHIAKSSNRQINYATQCIDNRSGKVLNEESIESGNLLLLIEAFHAIGNNAILVFSVYDTLNPDKGISLLSIVLDSLGKEVGRNLSDFSLKPGWFFETKSTETSDTSISLLIIEHSSKASSEGFNHFLHINQFGTFSRLKTIDFNHVDMEGFYSICKDFHSDSLIAIGHFRKIKLGADLGFTEFFKTNVPAFFYERHANCKSLNDGKVICYQIGTTHSDDFRNGHLRKINNKGIDIKFHWLEDTSMFHFSTFNKLMDFVNSNEIYISANRSITPFFLVPSPETTCILEKVDSNFIVKWRKIFLKDGNWNAVIDDVLADKEGGVILTISRQLLEGNIFNKRKTFIVKITEDGRELVTSTDNYDEANPSILLFPNPSSGEMVLNFEKAEGRYSIEIVDANGHSVRKKEFVVNSEIQKFEFYNLPLGVYYYRLINESNNIIDSGPWIKN